MNKMRAPPIVTRQPRNDSRKKYELLKTSWIYQTQQFFDNSTLHGVRYINEDGRPFCEKFMWFCFTSVGGVVTLIIIVSLWEKFQTNPTITGLDTDFHSWEVLFPTVSICPELPVNTTELEEYVTRKWPNADEDAKSKYQEFLILLSNISYSNLKSFSKYEKDPVLSSISDYREILNEITMKCPDLIDTCNFKAEGIRCCDHFRPILTEVGYCIAFNSKHAATSITGEKPAKIFKPMDILETDQKWSLDISFHDHIIEYAKYKHSFKIYLHSTEDVPVVDVNPQHVWNTKIAKIAFSSKTTYTTKEALQLTIKQRRCVFEDEVKLVTNDIYTYSSCMIQCRMQLAKQHCKCVPYFYSKIDGFPYCDLKGMACIGEHEKEFLEIQNCACELGCTNTVYEVEKMNIATPDSDNFLDIGFVSWPMVRYKREVLFGWVDLLVSFGGIAGLFLGFSLLSGVEIVYYFTMRAICMLYRDKEELQRLQEEYEKAEKPPLDLQLRPTFMRKASINTVNNQEKQKIKVFSIPSVPTKVQPISVVSGAGSMVDVPKSLKPYYSRFEFLP